MKPRAVLSFASSAVAAVAMVAVIAIVEITAAAPLHAAVDPFYAELLRDGIHAYNAADYPEAARDLRLACFGMLEDPDPLVDCLARLALAQDKAGDQGGFRESFRRISEAEERFGSYTRASLPADLRSAFEQRAAALIPAATLEALPAFRPLAARAAAAQSPAGKSRKGKPERQASSPPAPVSAPPAAPASPPAPSSSASASATPARTAPGPVTDAEKEKMASARRLLGEEGKTRELKQAFQLAREVADAHPESVEAQHLAAEAAYRISRWGDAATYFHRGGDPGESQPELLFYMAVSLYESGDTVGAAAALRRSLPNLQRTPYVDGYAKKILGT
jgi:hypothetical protein